MVRIIKEQKATLIVEGIMYNRIEGTYDSDIFTTERHHTLEGAMAAKKNVTDYLFTDSKGERKFAEALDSANEVCVYARLPKSFHIPTPVGKLCARLGHSLQRRRRAVCLLHSRNQGQYGRYGTARH